jgi:hypothetical protein
LTSVIAMPNSFVFCYLSTLGLFNVTSSSLLRIRSL